MEQPEAGASATKKKYVGGLATVYIGYKNTPQDQINSLLIDT